MPQENPFQDPLRFERRVPECAMVIFGANGDLTKRKLMPALYRLAYDRRLSAGFAVIGISRSPMSDDQFREKMLEAVKKFSEDTEVEDDLWKTFAAGLFYVAGDIDNPKVYTDIAAKLKEVEAQRQTGGNVLFYLSTQPSQYAPAALGIGAAGMGKGQRMAPPHCRKAVRARSRQRARAERQAAPGLRRIRRLPHRSLLGQRDRAEHPGLPFRQRHLRAALEPALREPRADHRRRIHRRRRPRRLLSGSRRAGRHDPEPSSAGDGHHRHGTQRRDSTPTRCATSARSCYAPYAP